MWVIFDAVSCRIARSRKELLGFILWCLDPYALGFFCVFFLSVKILSLEYLNIS